jgi:hypothetical protein
MQPPGRKRPEGRLVEAAQEAIPISAAFCMG